MASTHKSLRSGTANKRPTTSIADGQIALNTNVASPGLYFKDSTGASIIKIGPVHVGTTAPNVSPAGSAGNSTGEAWLDTSLTPNGWKVWTGAAFVNATPAGSATVQGLLELATDAETQAGSDAVRAVTPAGLQSKISDSTSTTSSTTIASSTAVKAAYDLANGAITASGGTVTGNLEIGTTGSLTFEGATANAFETAIAVVDPTADRTITLPDTTGTVITSGDTGTVTSAMLAGSIADSKLSTISTAGKVSNSATTATNANTASAIVARDGSGNFSAGTITATSFIPTGSTAPTNGVFLPSANSVGISTNSVAQLEINSVGQVLLNGLGSAAAPAFSWGGDPNTGIYRPGADEIAISTGGTGRLFVNSVGSIGLGGVTSSGAVVTIPNNASNDTIYFSGTNGTKLLSGSTTTFDIGITENTGTAPIRFLTTNTERLRITSAGNVGIGTASPATTLDLNGAYAGNITAVAALNLDLSTANYFTKTIAGNSTFTVSNTPASRAFAFTLELTHTSGTITWFSGVEWPGGTAPTLTTGKTHLFMFVTDDGGTRWRASSLINYTN